MQTTPLHPRPTQRYVNSAGKGDAINTRSATPTEGCTSHSCVHSPLHGTVSAASVHGVPPFIACCVTVRVRVIALFVHVDHADHGPYAQLTGVSGAATPMTHCRRMRRTTDVAYDRL